MDYSVKIIKTPQELLDCHRFEVAHFQWTCRKQPRTYGYMGYLPDQGLLIRMTCMEEEPLCRMVHHRERVCQDSAMEVFMALPDKPSVDGKMNPPRDSGLYLNYEVNSVGAMYAKYGYGRQERFFLTDAQYTEANVRTWVKHDQWSMELLISQELIAGLSGIQAFGPGDVFYINFYKISETPEIEHYGSYAPLDSEAPNFHLPHCFARAIVEA